MNNRQRLLVVVIAGVTLSSPSLLWASASQAVTTTAAEVAAIAKFDDAIAKYMALRGRLKNEVKGPVKDSSSTQLTGASDALAGGIIRSRRDARVGSIFVEPVATLIKQRLAALVRTAPVLSGIDDDGLPGPTPSLHLRLPVSEQMATMPPSVLSVLPPLPKELEYRIVGRYLVLRDIDASLIIDFIPGAVTR